MSRAHALTALAAASVLLLAACSQQTPPAPGSEAAADAAATDTGFVRIDGSSTVYPVTEAVAEEFQIANRGATKVTVGVSGTGGGFKKLCRGEIDIANASRPISKEEMEACAANGIRYFEVPIGFDALTVVIHPSNDFASEMSIDQLRTLWEPAAQETITRWNQVDPSWPDRPVTLYGAGADSGTFDYFTEAVMGKAKSSRGDFTASEDDNVLVQGVAQDVDAIGYFGFAYYAENTDKLKAVAIRATPESEAVYPSEQTVMDGSYQPMSRPMFVYVNDQAWKRPEVQAFLGFYLDNVPELAREVKYVPLPESAYDVARALLENERYGTIFKGEPSAGVTIDEMLKRQSAL